MTRRVFVTVKVEVVIDVEEGIETDKAMNALEVAIAPATEGVWLDHWDIADYEIMDSK